MDVPNALMPYAGKRVLMIIGGGIAAYKGLELIRRLRDHGVDVRCVMTQSATQFVTPLSVAALSENKVYQELFSLTDESEMGHIRLSREADLLLVLPATANLMAKMAHGFADDLASTVLIASDKPIVVAPAMNPMMWANPATQANVATLKQRGISFIGPVSGDMACGEVGAGRLVEPSQILAEVLTFLEPKAIPLKGKKALVTSGPTHEVIDPVRYIANRSSGKQGHAIAEALAEAGAEVTLVSGPVALSDPPGCTVIKIESAHEMLTACQDALPVDIAVFAAAVADWRPKNQPKHKLKKQAGQTSPTLETIANPDILHTIAKKRKNQRPGLVVGFAAETNDVVDYASTKRTKKKADWIVANDVSPQRGTFGGDQNQVHFITSEGVESWPQMDKTQVATQLIAKISSFFDLSKSNS